MFSNGLQSHYCKVVHVDILGLHPTRTCTGIGGVDVGVVCSDPVGDTLCETYRHLCDLHQAFFIQVVGSRESIVLLLKEGVPVSFLNIERLFRQDFLIVCDERLVEELKSLDR